MLGKPPTPPDVVANQLQLETFIAFEKATKGLTVSGEKWLRVTLGPFLQWLPASLANAGKQHIIQFLAQYEGKPWRRHSFYRAFKTFWKGLAGSKGLVPPIGHRLGRLDMIPYSCLQLSKLRNLTFLLQLGRFRHFEHRLKVYDVRPDL